MKFSDVLDSYSSQAAKTGCLEDWLDYFHSTINSYFEECEEENRRATIKGLKQEIIKTATSDLFKFN